MGINWRGINTGVAGCMGMCPTPSPFHLEILKEVPDTGNFVIAMRHPANYRADQREITVTPQVHSLAMICDGNQNARIKFALVADHQGPNRVELHHFETTILSLAGANGSTQNFQAQGSTLTIREPKVYVRPSFIEYLRSGWAVSLVAAIDYTASNGNPSDRSSLHYLGGQNQYQSCLMNVGAVVEPYDTDRSFPVFGFGGIPRHLGINGVSHCFAMNGNAANPEIVGIDGIVQTYC